MSVAPKTQPLVSVIVPVYNGEEFIERCLDSVLAQSMQDFELIVVNDGSTDDSLSILNRYAAAHESVRVLDQENAGQGAARNRALGEARGEFILFVDADDFIERVTLQVTTERAVEDSSDLVHFDWKLYTPNVGRPGDFHYYNADPFWHKRMLVGPECDELLRVQNFYSVTKLYRRSFLERHEIRFEEGRIYEDNPFVLQAVNRAQTASLVHSPLYTIDPRPDSSTRSHTDSDKHVRDHLYAVRRTFELLDRRNPRAVAYLAAYHVKKIGPYYERRIPRRHRRAYVSEFVEILHEAKVTIPPATSTNAPMRLSSKLQLFEQRRQAVFRAMIVGKNAIMPRYKRAKQWAKKLKNRRSPMSATSAVVERALVLPVLGKTISFIGLDYRYTGNSRYLFEEIIQDPQFADYDIRFVTADLRVEPQYRLEPNTPRTQAYLARTKVLLAESWIPEAIRKHPEATWVQLWHGTPLKRMLFDSHEPRIIWNRRHHKTAKYRDILTWDYLVVDSALAAEKFETAFLFPPEKMIRSGYPRVDFLVDDARAALGRAGARERLGMDASTEGTKLVLYAPTWRDANYGRSPEESDFSYALDIAQLADDLGETFTVAFHDHSYLATGMDIGHPRCLDASAEEIQDLLLAADVVVTDYSSLVFDAQAIGLPVVFFTPDLEEFEEFRGLYPEMRRLAGEPCVQPAEVSEAIRNIQPQDPKRVAFPGYRRERLLQESLLRLLEDKQSTQAPTTHGSKLGDTA